MTEQGDIDFDTLRPEEFEHYLPDLFATGNGALVRDLETIAETARSLFEPVGDPSDKVWTNIQSKLREESALTSASDDDLKKMD
jgi:hypothetical protein